MKYLYREREYNNHIIKTVKFSSSNISIINIITNISIFIYFNRFRNMIEEFILNVNMHVPIPRQSSNHLNTIVIIL